MSRDRSRLSGDEWEDRMRRASPSAEKIRGGATSNYRPSARAVRGRVYRFNGVGREKYPRHVGATTKGRKEWKPPLSGFRGIFFRAFHVDKKCGTQTFPGCNPRVPRARRPPAVDAMVVVYSFFSFFKKNDVFIGYV